MNTGINDEFYMFIYVHIKLYTYIHIYYIFIYIISNLYNLGTVRVPRGLFAVTLNTA